MFARQKRSSFAFACCLGLSLALMFSDYHYRYLAAMRNTLAVVVSPLQYAVDYPVHLIGGFRAKFKAKSELIDENLKLRHQQAMLSARLQKLLVIKEENSQLKELLNTSSKTNMKTMASQILAVDTSSSRQILVINKGKRDKVYIGQPVLDANGVMGQVIDAGYMTSSVLLVSDAKSAVPVRNYRTGERAILVGTNKIDQLSLINLPRTSSVLVGDLLVTSGLARRYPEGYPVGRVKSVENIPGDAFVKVGVEPLALLNRNRLALLIWPGKTELEWTRQVSKRLAMKEKES